MNEIEFLSRAEKVKTQLKRKKFNKKRIKGIIFDNKKIKYANCNNSLKVIYRTLKKNLINDVSSNKLRHIMVFYGFFTDNKFDILDTPELISFLKKNDKDYYRYKNNMIENFTEDFFNLYGNNIEDIDDFFTRKIYNYGFFRELLDFKISLMFFLVLDEIFMISEFMEKEKLHVWDLYKFKIKNCKSIFKIYRQTPDVIKTKEKLFKKISKKNNRFLNKYETFEIMVDIR